MMLGDSPEYGAKEQKKLLIIDDHPFFLDGLKLALQSLADFSISVDVLADAQAALDLGSQIECYDLILCDLNLPKVSGLDFIRSLVSREHYVRVAIISASERSEDVTRALRQGAAGFINKGLNLPDFRSALLSILAGQRYVPPRDGGCGQDTSLLEAVNLSSLGITDRQLEVLTRLSGGMSNKQISSELEIKETTVKSHLQVLFQALNVTNRTACIVRAREIGLLSEGQVS